MGLSPWFLERRENQEIYQLEFGETLIGRMENTQIVITSVFASRKHCLITVSKDNPDDVYLEDLGTCNGTWVNTSIKRSEKIRIREGDNIGIGCSIIEHDDDKYFTFTVKRDNVLVENIIINIDDDDEEEEDEDYKMERQSVDEIEQEILDQEIDDDLVEVIDDDDDIPEEVKYDPVVEIKDEEPIISPVEAINDNLLEDLALEVKYKPPDDEVEFEQEEEIEKEISFSLKQEMLDEIIEIEDIFNESDNNIEEDEDLFNQYKLKQELSMREDSSSIVLISDSEDDDIIEMNNWVMKLSQNVDGKKSFRNVKIESDEENEDIDILNELRSVLGHLPGDNENENEVENQKPDAPTLIDELIEPKLEIDEDSFVQVIDPPPPIEEIPITITPLPEDAIIPPIKLCSVILEKCSIKTKSNLVEKSQSESDDEVKPPKKKFKRILSKDKALFGSDDEEENVNKIQSKKPEPQTKSRGSDKTSRHENHKRKISLEEPHKTSSRKKSESAESGPSKISKSDKSRHERKRHRSRSKDVSETKSMVESKSKQDQPKTAESHIPIKVVEAEPERDSDFVEEPIIPNETDDITKTILDSKKPRQLEIIEPLSMPNRRRSTKETSDKIEKTKFSEDLRRIQKRTIMTQKHENYLQNMKKKYKQGYPANGRKSSRSEIPKVTQEQKIRLQQIALANKCEKEDDEPKVVNMPKVKVTEQNRGSFLTEDLPCKLPGRRKSISATEIRTNEEPKPTNKLSSINDLGTVGKSISAFPKIPKVARTTSIENSIKSPPLPHIPAQITLAKTALKPRIARIVSEDLNNSPKSISSPQHSVQETELVVLKKSILTKQNSAHKTTKPLNPKTVRFNDNIKIKYYEVIYDKKLLNVSEDQQKENNIAKLKTLKSMNDAMVKKPLISLNLHPCENVINDITQWNTDWLKMSPTVLPDVNGSKLLLPIVHSYRNCKEYENIMIPLMKVELWHQIRNDYEMRKKCRCRATVVNGKLVLRGQGMRYEFVCELQNIPDADTRESIKEGMMLKISAGEKHFFAYMIFKDCMKTKDREVTYITIHSAKSAITETIHNGMRIDITCIAYIRAEVINMGFIYDMKESPLCDMILDPSNKIEIPVTSNEYNPLLDLTLNEGQYNIVNYATQQCLELEKPSVILIEGPPGTGKSYLISNLVSTLLYIPENAKLKILICSATNNAIDIIMEKLILIRQENKKTKSQREIRLLRYGVHEKMSPAVQAYSLQNLCKKNINSWKRDMESSSIVGGTSIKTLLNERTMLKKLIGNLKANGCSSSKIDEIGKLEKDLNRIENIINGNHIAFSEQRSKERELMTNLISKAEVICTTLTSCVQLMRTLRKIDICIIDEATQCTEPWSIIPLKFNIKKLILVGDTKQLPAVILSTEAKQNGLGNSLFTRIQESFEATSRSPVLPMKTQYRMHPEICEFPNKYFYNKQLVSCYKLTADVPLRPYSVISLDFLQNGTCDRLSVYNTEEAKFVSHLMYEISKMVDFEKVEVGIITPYQQQKTEITKALSPYKLNKVSVNTIDSFQGKEADIIILTTTRTTGTGFLGHSQRLNVALTRARHSLIICGNFLKLKHVPIWSSLIEDAIVRQLFYKFDNKFEDLLPKLI